ncbi:MAG: glucose-1-phosphate cytidylyltransferase [Verrucomicrobiota bacterium]
MKVVILCGGKGTRLREETEFKPKPMVEIGGRPILWHIMRHYAHYGYNEFVLALGYKGHAIKDYFLSYHYQQNDVTVNTGSGSVEVHPGKGDVDWKVTLVDTGEDTLKGARIAMLAPHIDSEEFMVTYGDGVSDVDLDKLKQKHHSSGATGTFTGVRMPSRFGAVQTDDGGKVLSWEEKPLLEEYINSGFFIFKREFLSYLTKDPMCDLEKKPLERLASEGKMAMYKHDGFWHCMDTQREYHLLNEMWASNKAPWRTWK